MVIQGVTYLSDFEAKKAIMEMARRLEAKGWLVAGDGSMSVRVGPQAVWVTVAGADKAALTQDMLVRVDMNGKAMLSAKPKPLPEDLPIHLKIYQENENAQCVMHTYPACAAVMGMQGQTVQPAAFSPAVRALGRVQLLPPRTWTHRHRLSAWLCRTDKAVLLENGRLPDLGQDPGQMRPIWWKHWITTQPSPQSWAAQAAPNAAAAAVTAPAAASAAHLPCSHGSARCTACGQWQYPPHSLPSR